MHNNNNNNNYNYNYNYKINKSNGDHHHTSLHERKESIDLTNIHFSSPNSTPSTPLSPSSPRENQAPYNAIDVDTSAKKSTSQSTPIRTPSTPQTQRRFKRWTMNVPMEEDHSVMKTNDEAASCKLALVKLDYIRDDPFVSLFVRQAPSRAPIINRGYFARVHAIHQLQDDFMQMFAPLNQPLSNKAEDERIRMQVINLGAGFDTSFWLFKNRIEAEKMSSKIDLKYVEVDFANVVNQKIKIIKRNALLNSVLQNVHYGANGDYITSGEYQMWPVDLRDFDGLQKTLIEKAGIDTNVPTLFLSEMVLVYLDPRHSQHILKWCSQEFAANLFVLYEQVGPHDPFGRVMVSNLRDRLCPLRSIFEYPTTESQQERFIKMGYQKCTALDMVSVYHHIIDQRERQRIERLEIFDEYEEWYMIMGHYCLAVAMNEHQSSTDQAKKPDILTDEEWDNVKERSAKWRGKWRFAMNV